MAEPIQVRSTRSRHELEEALKRGEAVSYRGRYIDRIEALPTDAEMASDSGDTGYMDRTRREKEEQIEKLEAEVKQLRAQSQVSKQQEKPNPATSVTPPNSPPPDASAKAGKRTEANPNPTA